MKKELLAITVLASTAMMLPTVTLAEYPEKPVSFVVPFPPGYLEDILTRVIAEEFEETYGVPAAVINKPGGGGGPFPGAAEVAAAPADGYTIGSFVIDVPVAGPFVGIPALDPNPFEPVGIFLTYPFVIATSASQPYSSAEELAAYAKENNVVLGHFGEPLVPTQVAFGLAKEMGFEFSSNAAFDDLNCNSLASGDVDVITTDIAALFPCIDDVNIIATIGTDRLVKAPDVPTVGELFPELNVSLWNGLFVHKDTPQDIRDKISAVAEKAMSSEAAQKISRDTSAVIYWTPAAESQSQIEADMETLGGIEALLAN